MSASEFIQREIERAILSAEFPSGMSVHDGKARVDAAHLRRVMAELEALRADAERYRWVRDHLWSQSDTTLYALPIAWAVDADKRNAGDNMDAAIDEARKEAP